MNEKRSNTLSWILFLICIGFLFIMLSPKMPNPIIGLILGLIIVLTGTIIFKKENLRNKNK